MSGLASPFRSAIAIETGARSVSRLSSAEKEGSTVTSAIAAMAPITDTTMAPVMNT